MCTLRRKYFDRETQKCVLGKKQWSDQMLNGKVCIKRQRHLKLPLFKGKGTLRGVQAESFLLEANWQSLWKDARSVILFPGRGIDFNTNGDLNWTLSSSQKFPSLVRKPWSWHSGEFGIRSVVV